MLLFICACLQHKDAAKLDKLGVVDGLARALHTTTDARLDAKCIWIDFSTAHWSPFQAITRGC